MTQTLDRELDQVLRTGPFSVALHLAIECRGWTLDRLCKELLERGVGVSLSTLSYWRRGRSRPERPDSLRAVRGIEEALELPEGSLSTLVSGQGRPRGRWLEHEPASLPPERLWHSPEGLARAFGQLGGVPEDQLVRVSAHEEYQVGHDRRGVSLRNRTTLLAMADKVTHCRVIYWADNADTPPPVLGELRHCRAGRVRQDPETGFTVAELLLDRVLRRGELIGIEYELLLPPAGDEIDEFCRRVALPMREYGLTVAFHPSALPVSCLRFHRPAVTGPERDGQPVWINGQGIAQLTLLDVAPGLAGLRWEWE